MWRLEDAMRKTLIAGNWKMNLALEESETLARELVEGLPENLEAEVLICPPYTSLDRVFQVIRNTPIQLGAQDMHWEDQGAFTGKISWDMLRSVGVTHVILGHSEQRTYFHETDESVNRKVRKALQVGMTPVICVGETLEERDRGEMERVVRRQVEGAYRELSSGEAGKTILAYEPVWAIGTGRTATPDQAQEAHAMIRGLLQDCFGDISSGIRILYGGSMKPSNAAKLLACPDIDGGLIGGASLKAPDFLSMIGR